MSWKNYINLLNKKSSFLFIKTPDIIPMVSKMNYKLNNKICVSKLYYYDVLTNRIEINKNLKDKIRKCKEYYLLQIILYNSDNTEVIHYSAIILDIKKKKVIIFNTDHFFNKLLQKIVKKLIVQIFKLKYKIFINKNCLIKMNEKGSLCFPLSLLYIFLYIKYKTDINEYTNFLLKKSKLELDNIASNFLKKI